MSKCPNCGGELSYNVKDSVVKCEYCGSSFNPKELETKSKYATERHTFEGKSFNCTQCGAELLSFDETAVTFCSYCGSQAIIESKMMKVNNPDYIIPFKITKEEAINNYKSYLNKALFVPKYMKEDMTIDKFRGIFMPYGIYKTSFHGTCNNKGEKYNHRSGDYVYYDVYTISAQVDADYEGISYDLLSKFNDYYSMNVPFEYDGIEKFNKNYLMGYYADSKDVDSSVYDNKAERISTSDSTNYLRLRDEFRKYGCSSPKTSLKVSERKSAMFPVYFLGVKDSQGKMHYAVVNGQTGKVAADLPIDSKKFVLFTLLFAILIFVGLYFFNVILPQMVLMFSLVAVFISMLISISQLKKIFNKEYHLDDEGYLSKNMDFEITEKTKAIVHTASSSEPKEIKSKEIIKDGKRVKKYKFKNIAKQVFTLILGVLVLTTGTIMDEVYYISSFVCFIIIMLSFIDLIKEHNELSSNKPPQLEKRGGDEVGK